MLTREDLEILVQRGESETLEFKRSTSDLESAFRSVSGLLNAGTGGYVLFGVANDGRVIGMEASERTVEDVATCVRHIEPDAGIRIDRIQVAGARSVIVVVVPASARVHTYRGIAFRRVGNTTERMPFDTFERRLVEQAHRGFQWESMPSAYSIDDLDHDEVLRTVNEAVRRQRLNDPRTRNVPDLLLGLGLLEDDVPKNAALVLFGKSDRLRSRLPQCTLRLARFRGITKSEFIDGRQLMGNAFDFYQAAQQFWIEHLPVAGRIRPDAFERQDTPLYPTEALREALANAICHRDYSVIGGAIDIAIYDDRLEVVSTGPLRFGLSPADLLRPHQSLKWNPLIANAFYLRGIIEAWGRGTLKIIELAQSAGLPDPEFETNNQSFTVRFLPSRYMAPKRIETDLSELQQEMLQILGTSGSMSLGDIRMALSSSPSERAVQENLRVLRSMGLVAMEGSRRWARWQLKR